MPRSELVVQSGTAALPVLDEGCGPHLELRAFFWTEPNSGELLQASGRHKDHEGLGDVAPGLR